MKKVSKDSKYNLMKTVIVIIVYLLYSFVFSSISGAFNISNSIIVSFIADICFLIFVILMYKDKIISDMNKYHSNSIKRRILTIVSWVLIIFVTNLLGTYLSTLTITEEATANNVALLSLPYIYTFFKTLIFGSIAEELVFKESIRSVVKSNIVFIIVSTLIYSTMNIAYTSVSGLALIGNAIPYALFAIVTGILYLRHKDNIYVVMIVKLFYNLIPLIVMLGGIG